MEKGLQKLPAWEFKTQFKKCQNRDLVFHCPLYYEIY